MQLFKDNFRDDMKNNLKDLTVIVGENGVGKTTISELLLSPINYSGKGSKRIYILHDGEYIQCYCSGEWENDLSYEVKFDNIAKKQKEIIQDFMGISENKYYMKLLQNKDRNINYTTLDFFTYNKISLIYDSNAFSYQSVLKNNEIENNQYTDISLGGAYLKNRDKYFEKEFLSQMDFIISERKIVEEKIDFSLPNSIFMNLNKRRLEGYRTRNGSENENLVKNILIDIVNEIEDQKIGLKHLLMFTSFIYVNRILFPKISFNKHKKKLEEIEIQKEYSNLFDEWIININKSIKNDLSYDLSYIIENLYTMSRDFITDKCKDFYSLEDKINNLDEIISISEQFSFDHENSWIFDKNIDVSSEEKLKVFYEFYNTFRRCEYIDEYIGLNWVMSTGENVFLNTLAKYHRIKNEITNKSVIVFIDEGDLYLHPRWQQRYIDLIIKCLNIMFEGKEVQLIITTHSPIILSDVPKNNVIFMSRDVSGNVITDDLELHKETFGGNIFDLYNNSFFLSKSENGDAMGEIASYSIERVCEILRTIKKEIESIIKCEKKEMELKNYDNELEYCSCVINVLGDPVYSTTLKKQYDWIIKFIKKYKYEKEKNTKSSVELEARKKAIINIGKMELNEDEEKIVRAILKGNKHD